MNLYRRVDAKANISNSETKVEINAEAHTAGRLTGISTEVKVINRQKGRRERAHDLGQHRMQTGPNTRWTARKRRRAMEHASANASIR